MFYRLLVSACLIAGPAVADMPLADSCALLGEIAAQAVGLKAEGVTAEAATETLRAGLETDDAVVLARIEPVVRFAFMAGMSPDGARDYYLSQCLKS